MGSFRDFFIFHNLAVHEEFFSPVKVFDWLKVDIALVICGFFPFGKAVEN